MRLGTYKGIHMTRPNTEVTEHEVMNVLKKKHTLLPQILMIAVHRLAIRQFLILKVATTERPFRTEMEKTLH